ncbi:glycosyltransferase family 2 protein [Chryseobacterium sp.]|uniref:glycosyltransferase family 2 protein n=1 Tax=Chryseobacterium sp. TaxID=1871047 RepID=UPI0028992D8F|nr:glycosyltransferase family 2 protein [Chryseobacterium sp.]
MTKTALLISTYNWESALDLVLQSVELQSIIPFEILIADDGSGESTRNLILNWQNKSSLNIKHFWQEDDGFRKTIIMNKAIAESISDYIIQIDGDIIMDKDFIKDHLKYRKKGFFINGSRALISESNTKKIIASGILNMNEVSKNVKNKINATRFPLASFIFRKDHYKSDNVKGCNFSFWKKDFIEVNGYNNEMNGWGHEDIELAARLNNLGIKQRRLKMVAVCYHLYHKYCDRKNELKNLTIYQEIVKNKIIRTNSGMLD